MCHDSLMKLRLKTVAAFFNSALKINQDSATPEPSENVYICVFISSFVVYIY